ncbi:MAG: hypothetical protein LBM56_01600 [Burkholderiaceae bacterium]|nr:hypothetical protein [Burkholderiaceae bacterium]
MEKFWAFVNTKPVRLVLAVICLAFLTQGIYRVQVAQTDMQLFRGGGEILLWGGWMLANILRAYGKVARKLSIAVNTGLVMVLVSMFMK